MPYKNYEDYLKHKRSYYQTHKEKWKEAEYLKHKAAYRVRYDEGYKNSEAYEDRKKSTMLFKDKKIRLPFYPRDGKCEMCGGAGKDGMTYMHHDQWDDKDPIKYTRELCPSCHMKEQHKKGVL